MKSTLHKNNKLAQRICLCLVILFALVLLSPIAVFAEDGGPEIQISNIETGIQSMTKSIASFASPICVLVFVVAGLAMMSGQQGRQWAKTTVLFAAIGFGIVQSADAIVSILSSSF